MFYYLYEIRNNINGKVYIGVHKTKTKQDNYMGSGKLIKLAIKKYGLNSFTKQILEEFPTQEAMYEREKELINSSFLARGGTYNLREGGFGGFDWINNSGVPKFAGKSHSEKTKKLIASLARTRKHSEETRKKLVLVQKSFRSGTEKGKIKSEKLSKSLIGRKLTSEHKVSISKALKNTHFNRVSLEVINEVQRLHGLGKSDYYIASTLGIARNTVIKYRKEHAGVLDKGHPTDFQSEDRGVQLSTPAPFLTTGDSHGDSSSIG